jgi:hypothetical protein
MWNLELEIEITRAPRGSRLPQAGQFLITNYKFQILF